MISSVKLILEAIQLLKKFFSMVEESRAKEFNRRLRVYVEKLEKGSTVKEKKDAARYLKRLLDEL